MLGARVKIALLLLAFVGACFGYYYGIHQPRERARQKREKDSREAEHALADRARTAAAEQERVKADAEKAKTKRIPEESGSRSPSAQSLPAIVPLRCN